MRRFALAVIGIAALGALAVPAGAGQQVETSLSFRLHPGMDDYRFDGKVGSPKQACKSHRRVKVFQRQGQDNERIGTDKTDAEGKWEKVVDPPPSGHRFYAKVERKETSAGTCLGVKTDTVNVNN